jgi:predicted ATPase
LQQFEQSLVDKHQWLTASAFEPEMIRPFATWHDALSNAGNTELLKLFSGESKINREFIFEKLASLVTQLASNLPLVILFDDAQWCDESSIALLHYVFRRCQSLPLLLILAVRGVEMKENKALTQIIGGFRHEARLSEISLRPLDDKSITRLIKTQAPGADVEQLVHNCAGNPLFAIELARADAGGRRGDSLSDLVNSRLSRQEDSVIEVLRWAAVISPNIQLRDLEQLCDISQHQLDQAIEAGVQQGILTYRDIGLSFSHDLVARAIYANISPARRQTMHRRVAEQLEIATSKDLQLAAELARHAQQSGDAALAARSIVQAALLCLRFYAYEEALSLSQKGIKFTEHLSEAERIAITIDCLEIQLTASPPQEWEAAADLYKELAEKALDHGAMSHARRGYQMASYVKWAHGEWADAQQESMQAERISRRGDQQEHITGMAEAAKCLALLERELPSADAMLMEAEALARRNAYYIGAIPAGIGIIRYLEGRFQESEELLLDARTVFKTDGDRINEFQSNEYLTMIAIEQNDYHKALSCCLPLLKMAEKLRNGSEMPFASGLEALCQLALDNSQDGSSMQSHFESLRQLDAKQRLAYLLNRSALIMLMRESYQQAVAWSEEAFEAASCLSRYSEMLLARLIQYRCDVHTNSTASSEQQLAALHNLYQRTGANWAKEQVSALLMEKGVI